MVRVEKVLDQQETALGVFLDIEEAFNTPPVAPCVILTSYMGLITPLYGGLERPWRAAWLWRLSVVLQ